MGIPAAFVKLSLRGAPSRSRTCNPRVKSPLLCQLSYRREKWYPLTDSNRRHSVCRTDALPVELRGHGGQCGSRTRHRRALEAPAEPICLLPGEKLAAGEGLEPPCRFPDVRFQGGCNSRSANPPGFNRCGAPHRIRTGLMPLCRRPPQPLSQRGVNWWTRADSNRQHSACRADVLPLELRARVYVGWRERNSTARKGPGPIS